MSLLKASLKRPTIYIDPKKCMGCRSCEIACAVEHSVNKTLFKAISEKPIPKPRLKVVVADSSKVPLRCQHCEDAPCIKVCPTKAIKKSEDGFVILNANKCVGCLMCVRACCQSGHLKYEPEYKIVLKCDLCIERLREGREPACVEACPTKALKFGTLEEILDRKKKAEELISDLKAPGIVYIEPVIEEKENKEKVSPIDVNTSYSKVKWYS
ncbi:hypothetical protein JCM12825_15400 [Desulfurobacterium crinifex]